MVESQSVEDLSAGGIDRNESLFSSTSCLPSTGEEGMAGLDVLQKTDDGMEIALERAKVLSKYLQDLLLYVKKKAQLEITHANNLMKLCSQVKPTLTEQSF